jgi:hypothetical protein
MAKQNPNSVPKKVVPSKSDGRVEETHVQPAPENAAPNADLPGAPAFPVAVIAEAEGLVPREDLLSAEGMTFGDLDRGVAPSDPAQWYPTSQ